MSSAEQLTVRSHDVDIAVYVSGQPDATTLLLVHGYPDDHTVWDGVVEELASSYRVVTYDVRGSGQSTVPDAVADYDMVFLVDDCLAVINAVSPGQAVHLVGHDWGSIQSWEAVCSDRLNGRIASFTSISGPGLDHAGMWLRERLRRPTPRALLDVTVQLFRAWYVLFFMLPGLAPALWRRMGKYWPRQLRAMEGVQIPLRNTQVSDGVNGIKLYRANFARHVFSPREKHAHAPVQILVPNKDRFVSPRLADDLKRWVPRLWRRDLPLRHWLPLSNPELLAAYVDEFVQYLDGGADSAMPAQLQRYEVHAAGRPKVFAGRLAVITGAGGGIGRCTALALAEQGASIVVSDINADSAEATAAEVRELGVDAYARSVDVASGAAMQAFAQWVDDTLGTPDIVVNNAGIGIAGRFLDTSPEDWERVMRINVFGVIEGSRLFAQQMVQAGKGGNIVNIASAAAYSPTKQLTAYATSKAAVRMLNDCMRADLAGDGIHVSSICPGIVDTGITLATTFVGVDDSEQDRLRSTTKQMYQRRNLTPETVAKAIVKAVKHNRDEVPVGIESYVLRSIYHHWHWLARRLARVDLIN